MPRGGKRPGAGRKSGAAWTGAAPREPTVRDMAKSRVREVLTTASDPLAVLVEIANDEKVDTALRVQAASAACPYIFPRLSAAVVANVAPASREEHAEHADLVDRIMAKFSKLAPVATIEALPAYAETAA